MMHETKESKPGQTHFLTLTYDQDDLPEGATLVPAHFTLFMKRLRKQYGEGIRFYHCGEYGEMRGRPHYHAAVWNLDLDDLKPVGRTHGGTLSTSEELTKIWGKGKADRANLEFKSAAYIARYLLKKQTGPNQYGEIPEQYETQNDYGEVFEKEHEYTTMSRGEGIGKKWIDKYMEDVYKYDEVIVNQRKTRPPKYYDTRFKENWGEDALLEIKERRKDKIKERYGQHGMETMRRLEHRANYQEVIRNRYKREHD